MFCGMSPVTCATRCALSLDVTTPATRPCMSRSGPPELPGCTGAEICICRGSSRSPDSAETSPVVSVGPEDSSPASGKP